MNSISNRVGTAEEDFNNILLKLLMHKENEACILLFCLADDVTSVSSRWLLFSWVPDTCKVRDKMLYSSSREGLKRGLGIGHFAAEYSANSLSDVTWAELTRYITKDKLDGPLTERERLILEEKVR